MIKPFGPDGIKESEQAIIGTEEPYLGEEQMKKTGLVAMLLTASTLAFGQPQDRPRMGDRMREGRDRLMAQLHPTDQQQLQIKKFHLALERKQTELRSKIQLARLDMKEIYLSDKIDRSALEKLIKQVSDLQYQQKLNFVDFWFSVNSTLTPEQQKTWKQHVGGMAGQMRQRMRGAMRGRMMNRGSMQRGMMTPHPPEGNEN